LSSTRQPVENRLRQEGTAFCFDCVTADGPVAYRYEPRTGTLADIEALVPDEGTWRPFSGGGPVTASHGVVGDNDAAARLQAATIRQEAVVAVWQVSGATPPLTLTYTLQARGKTLTVAVAADRPGFSALTAGRILGGRQPQVFWVPHANCTEFPQPHVLITDRHFASVYFDWYVTESSAFHGAGDVGPTGAQVFDLCG
jgi:hypothetical protein